MAKPRFPRYGYAVDRHDTIVSVSPIWLAFAQENGASELTEQAVVGRCLWGFIDGVEVVELYQAILQRVRQESQRILLPFRCDSPTLRRYMRLDVAPQPDGGVQFYGILEHVEPTRFLNLLDADFPRSRDVLTMCSCCKRALVESAGWLEIDVAATQLGLLEQEQAPRLRQTVCPDCRIVPQEPADLHVPNGAP